MEESEKSYTEMLNDLQQQIMLYKETTSRKLQKIEEWIEVAVDKMNLRQMQAEKPGFIPDSLHHLELRLPKFEGAEVIKCSPDSEHQEFIGKPIYDEEPGKGQECWPEKEFILEALSGRNPNSSNPLQPEICTSEKPEASEDLSYTQVIQDKNTHRPLQRLQPIRLEEVYSITPTSRETFEAFLSKRIVKDFQNYPTSFSLYAEKILQNYEDILRQNQFYLQDRAGLKSALTGIAHCLSLLPHNRREDDLTSNSVTAENVLHAYEYDEPKESAGLAVISKKLNGFMPILVGCFWDVVPLVHTAPQLDAQSFDCMLPVLKSKDLIVQFFVYGTGQSQQELQTSLSSCTSQGVSYRGQDSIMVILKWLWDVFPLNHAHQLSEKEGNRYFILNIIITEIFLSFSDWIYPSSALLEKFLEFINYALLKKICSSMQLGRLFNDKHSVSLVAYIPKLLKQISGSWRSRILQGFTNVFKSCKPKSSLKMVCISAIEEFLDPENGWLYPESSDPEILDYQVTWLMELPSLLIQLGNKNSLSTKAVLLLQLLMGHLEGVTYLDSRGDGRYLISNGKDQTIKLWDTRRMSSSGNCEPIFRKYEWDYRWMDCPHQARNLKHPNDQSVATYNGHSVLRTLIHCYFSPAHSTGQKYIHTGSHDSCIYIYEVVSGAQVAKLQHQVTIYMCIVLRRNNLAKVVRRRRYTVTIFDPGGYLIVFMMSTCFFYWNSIFSTTIARCVNQDSVEDLIRPP